MGVHCVVCTNGTLRSNVRTNNNNNNNNSVFILLFFCSQILFTLEMKFEHVVFPSRINFNTYFSIPAKLLLLIYVTFIFFVHCSFHSMGSLDWRSVFFIKIQKSDSTQWWMMMIRHTVANWNYQQLTIQ